MTPMSSSPEISIDTMHGGRRTVTVTSHRANRCYNLFSTSSTGSTCEWHYRQTAQRYRQTLQETGRDLTMCGARTTRRNYSSDAILTQAFVAPTRIISRSSLPLTYLSQGTKRARLETS